MDYDLLIKNGTVIDGSGATRFKADVGIRAGRIDRVGVLNGSAAEVIDARDLVVAPGFVDAHTHMDAQVFWDPLGTSSCFHGVTSVVMGNCGFTIAPVREGQSELVLRNLERAEAIPAEVMAAGIEFSWQTFPEFLDTVDKLPKGINYAGYIGHSALRTFVMGEQAFTHEASPEQLAAMAAELRNALTAGAIGFSTSRNPNHCLPDDGPVASRLADWEEVVALVNVMRDLGTGVFEISREASYGDPDRLADFRRRLKDLAVHSRRPTTWGVFSTLDEPGSWRPYLALLDEAAEEGGEMFAQVHSHAMNNYWSFQTHMPFDALPAWRSLRDLSLDEQRAALSIPEQRMKLVESARQLPPDRAPDYERMYAMDTYQGPHASVAALGRDLSCHPVDAILQRSLECGLEQFFITPFANENPAEVLELIQHPRSVVTFSDSGAHVTQISDGSLQTHLFSLWVREKGVLTLEQAVRMRSFDVASRWGIGYRGLLREGYAADVVVFDPDKIAPLMPEVTHDLPTGAKRLSQRATGIVATIVNGEVLLRDGEHTGALPGELLRG